MVDWLARCYTKDNPVQTLKILKALLANVVSNDEVTQIIQEEIDKLEDTEADEEDSEDNEKSPEEEFGGKDLMVDTGMDMPLDTGLDTGLDLDLGGEEEFEVEPNEAEETLPSPDDLGIDMTQNF